MEIPFNPFEVIFRRLSNIENLLLDIKHKPDSSTPTTDTEPFGDFLWLCATCSGIPASTLRIKSAAGQIPGTQKVGRRVLYEKASVISWIRSNPVTPIDTALIERRAEAQVDTQISKRATAKVS